MILLGAPGLLAADEISDLEARLRALTGEIEAIKARDRSVHDAEVQRATSSERGRTAGFALHGALSGARLDESVRQRVLQRAFELWRDSPHEPRLLAFVLEQAQALEAARTDLSGKEDFESRRALLRAEVAYRTAQRNYFHGRQAFMEQHFSSLLRDFTDAMAESLTEVAGAVAGKLVDNVLANLQKVARARNLSEFKRAALGAGSGLLGGVTVEVFKAGLRESWVTAAMHDLNLPRYYASHLYDTYIIPDPDAGKTLEDKLTAALQGLVAQKIAQISGDRLGLERRLYERLNRLDAALLQKHFLTPEDVSGLLAASSDDAGLRRDELVQMIGGRVSSGLASLSEEDGIREEIDHHLKQISGARDATDLIVQLAAHLSADGLGAFGGHARGPVERAARSFHALEDWWEERDESGRRKNRDFGVYPRSASNRLLVLAATDRNEAHWDGERRLYERARELEAAWDTDAQVSTRDVQRAWLALEELESPDTGRPWPPFLARARAGLREWRDKEEKDGLWSRWESAELTYEKNGRSLDGAYDHGDRLRIENRYQISGLAEGRAVDVVERVGLADGGLAATNRRHEQDGITRVVFELAIPADFAPATHAVAFELSGAGADAFDRAGFTVSDVYPSWRERLAAGSEWIDACALADAETSLAALVQESESRRGQNPLFGSLHAEIEHTRERAREALDLLDRTKGTERRANAALAACDWPKAQRLADRALERLDALPAACSTEIRSTLSSSSLRATESMEHDVGFQRYQKAGERAEKSCELDQARSHFARAMALYQSGLADRACAALDERAAAVEASGLRVSRRLAQRDRIAELLNRARDDYQHRRDTPALRGAARALALTNETPEEERRCLAALRSQAVALATDAGKSLAAPSPREVTAQLPQDDSAQRLQRVAQRRRSYLEDRRQRADRMRQEAERRRAEARRREEERRQAEQRALAERERREEAERAAQRQSETFLRQMREAMERAQGAPGYEDLPAAPGEPDVSPERQRHLEQQERERLRDQQRAEEQRRANDAYYREQQRSARERLERRDAQERAAIERVERERRAREATRREIEDLRARRQSVERSLASATESLRCLEDGKLEFPRADLDCNGHYMIGTRDNNIEQLRRRVADLEYQRGQIEWQLGDLENRR